jgi:hypothetical protein
MKSAKSPSRAQRRLYEKYLKQLHPSQYKEWKSDALKRGEELQSQFIESTNKDLESQFENMQSKIIHTQKEAGKSQEEIDQYVEDWLSSTKIWREDASKKYTDLSRERALSNDKN